MVSEIIDHNEVLEWRWCTNNSLIPDPYWTSIFLVDGLMIDTGAPASLEELRSFLQQLPSDRLPTQCFITHAHEDHAGGAAMLAKEYQIPIYASELAHKFLTQQFVLTGEYRIISWGDVLEPVETDPLPPAPLTTKTDLYHFDYLPMPGHAPCLLALIEKEQQWAFVGDAVIPKRKMLFGGTCNFHEDIHQIYDSTKKLAELTEGMEHLRIFIAGYSEHDGYDFLQERLTEIEEDQHRQISEWQAQGLEPKKIVRKMFKEESFIASFTHGELSRLNLVESFLDWPLV